MMGGEGLTEATKVAILNANYVAHRLGKHFPVVYQGKKATSRTSASSTSVSSRRPRASRSTTVAKRPDGLRLPRADHVLPDPRPLMVEPTESESLAELDRFCEAMSAIREEIRLIEEGKFVARRQSAEERAAHHRGVHGGRVEAPLQPLDRCVPRALDARSQFWPSVGRLNNALGIASLICACPPIEAYADA